VKIILIKINLKDIVCENVSGFMALNLESSGILLYTLINVSFH
jgi:hypothetical protein